MQAAAIVGYKNSGKTSLMLRLTEHLSNKGLRVAAVKFTHHGLDRPGADTEQLSHLAHCVAGLGPEQTSLFWNKPFSLGDLLPLLDSDLLLIEGGRHLQTLPRIILAQDNGEVEALADGLAFGIWSETITNPGIPSFQDIPSLSEQIRNRAFMLPGLDCQACGYETCGQLARAILSGHADVQSCQAVSQELTISVNGEQLALNPFVRSIISGSILGMLCNLKGFAPGAIDIHLDRPV